MLAAAAAATAAGIKLALRRIDASVESGAESSEITAQSRLVDDVEGGALGPLDGARFMVAEPSEDIRRRWTERRKAALGLSMNGSWSGEAGSVLDSCG